MVWLNCHGMTQLLLLKTMYAEMTLLAVQSSGCMIGMVILFFVVIPWLFPFVHS